jgi:hypothetical protein
VGEGRHRQAVYNAAPTGQSGASFQEIAFAHPLRLQPLPRPSADVRERACTLTARERYPDAERRPSFLIEETS